MKIFEKNNLSFKKGFASACRRRDGFTLIELLVVVAIIGILASIILVSLGDSKAKSIDATIKSNLNTVKSQSQIFFTDNYYSFLPTNGSAFSIDTCPSYDSSGTNMFSKDKNIASAIAGATEKSGNGNACYNSYDYWAVAIGLKTDSSVSWCVDSEGNSKQVDSLPIDAINGTTFSCN